MESGLLTATGAGEHNVSFVSTNAALNYTEGKEANELSTHNNDSNNEDLHHTMEARTTEVSNMASASDRNMRASYSYNSWC